MKYGEALDERGWPILFYEGRNWELWERIIISQDAETVTFQDIYIPRDSKEEK